MEHQPGGVPGIFQSTKKLVLSEQVGWGPALEFLRKNAANGLSVANLLAGLSSILCSVNRWGKLEKLSEKWDGGVGVTLVVLSLWPSWCPGSPLASIGGKKRRKWDEKRENVVKKNAQEWGLPWFFWKTGKMGGRRW